MTESIVEPTGNPDYDRLPVPIKMRYSLQQWLWLSDGEKATLESRMCEPEWTE